MSLESYLIAAFAVTLTGISKSGFAGGLGVLGVPLVALTMPPQTAVVLLLPILIGIDALSVHRYRHVMRFDMILALLPGAALGIAVGMVSFSQIDPDFLRMAIGILALGFVARYFLASVPKVQHMSRGPWFSIFAASVVSGFAGFIAHAGGPPMKGTLLRLNLSKSAFVGTNALFFSILNLAKGAGYATLSLFSLEGFLSSASLIPFLLLGVWLGFALHDRISQRVFTNLAYGLLAIAGANLLIMGGVAIWSG